jgi:hypothetical protein
MGVFEMIWHYLAIAAILFAFVAGFVCAWMSGK